MILMTSVDAVVQHQEPPVDSGLPPQPPAPAGPSGPVAGDRNANDNEPAPVPVPIARRAIRRRDGRIVALHPSWRIPPTVTAYRSLQNAPNMRPTSQRQRAPLRREGAFHERWMPVDSPERQEVAGRDPSTLYENRT